MPATLLSTTNVIIFCLIIGVPLLAFILMTGMKLGDALKLVLGYIVAGAAAYSVIFLS